MNLVVEVSPVLTWVRCFCRRGCGMGAAAAAKKGLALVSFGVASVSRVTYVSRCFGCSLRGPGRGGRLHYERGRYACVSPPAPGVNGL